MTADGAVRARAVAVCRNAGRVLVERGYDRIAESRFYRAIGGHIDFGERALETAVREWREEYGLTLEDVRLLGVVENLFTYEGRPGHEVVFAFEARVVEPEVYEMEEFAGIDPDGRRHEAVWVSLDDLATGGIPLSPAGAGAAALQRVIRAAGCHSETRPRNSVLSRRGSQGRGIYLRPPGGWRRQPAPKPRLRRRRTGSRGTPREPGDATCHQQPTVDFSVGAKVISTADFNAAPPSK